MSTSNTETYHHVCTHSINSSMTTLLKCLGLVVAQPRLVVEIKATVALEEGE